MQKNCEEFDISLLSAATGRGLTHVQAYSAFVLVEKSHQVRKW